MSHAWLITGPPGSGRSNAARAFAAALQCPRGGCGECTECRTALSGAHPDVTLVRTEMLSIGVDEVRDLVRRAAMSPTLGRRQVIVVEDADRVTERGADALLKSIEEPAPRTVWMLCAPTADDVVVDHPLALPAAQPADPDGRRGGAAAADPRRGRARSWPPSPPASPRGTSAGPACWPATRPRASGGGEVLQIPRRLRDLGALPEGRGRRWWRRAPTRRPRRRPSWTPGSGPRWRRRWASAPGAPGPGRRRRPR